MKMNEYQELAARTHNRKLSPRDRMTIAALGLGGESGEMQELIKKHVGHGHDIPREAVIKELGDVLWYVAENATVHGVTLDEIAVANVAKLCKRYPEGFSEAASKARVDVDG